MKYDEQVLLKAAQIFKDRADQIVISCAIRYGILALGFGAAGIAALVTSGDQNIAPIVEIGVPVLCFGAGMWFGILRGRKLAFWLHVEAQKLIVLTEVASKRTSEAAPVA